MYALKIDEKNSLLKLTLESSPGIKDLDNLLNDLEKARLHFPEGYKLWIALPVGLRRVLHQELAKLAKEMLAGKGKGLQQVVIEGPPHNTFTRQVTDFLQSLYENLDIHVDLAYSTEESQKLLGLI